MDVPPDVPDVKKIKDEAKQELHKELEKKILVPMRSKLRGSGMIRSGGSAEQLLPSLDSVGEYYCGIVTQLGKAAELSSVRRISWLPARRIETLLRKRLTS